MILKKCESNKQGQPMCKKRDPMEEGFSVSRVKLERGYGYQGGKPTCVTCRKWKYEESLFGTWNCLNCGKEEHKRRHCPIIFD